VRWEGWVGVLESGADGGGGRGAFGMLCRPALR
jgi:hypothetical protein